MVIKNLRVNQYVSLNTIMYRVVSFNGTTCNLTRIGADGRLHNMDNVDVNNLSA